LSGKDVNMEYKDCSKYEAKLLDGQKNLMQARPSD